MTLAELAYVDVGAVLYDAGTLEQPTRKRAGVDRTWIMAGNSLCDRILLLPELRCVVIVWRERPAELVPLERCWRVCERQAA